MSIHAAGIPGHLPVPTGPARDSLGGRDLEIGAPARGAAPQPPASLGVAALAPPGTDPALWSVLTTEERAYFEHVQALGPVTYGPGAGSGDPAMPRGARLDLKV